jgi:hypothetical protein
MFESKNVNQVRGSALERVERVGRRYRIAFFGALAVEAFFLAGFVLLADFSNRTHVLLLVATVVVYTILALGSHVSRNTLRVLQAIELLGAESAADGR